MNKHDSMRGWFAYELYQQMKNNKDIWLVVGDLGYKVFDKHFEDFPDRCINTGAAEQAAAGICVGLALEGKIPFFYSITTFLLYRPFETIRTYINHEKLNVKLIGSGRDKDYEHDGISHWSDDAFKLFDPGFSFETSQITPPILDNIRAFWPEHKETIPSLMNLMIETKDPCFVSLRR